MSIDQSQIDDLNQLWHVILHSTLGGTSATQDERLQDLTTIDLTILREIAHKPDLILKEIRDLTHLPNSTLTSVIDRLERRGLLNRVITERDRRSYGLALTERGRAAYQAHFELEAQLFTAMLASLDSDEERATFLQLFRKIIRGVHHQQHASYAS